MPPSICLTLLLHLIFINFIFFHLLILRRFDVVCDENFLDCSPLDRWQCFAFLFFALIYVFLASFFFFVSPSVSLFRQTMLHVPSVCVCACLMFNETNLHRISYVVRRHTERRIRSRWPIYVPTFVLLSQMLTFIHISLRMVPYTICVNVSKVFSFQKLVARFFFFRIHWYILVCVFFNFMFSFSSRLCLCACSDVPATLTGKQLKKLPNQNGYKVKERPTCIDLRIPEVCQSDTSI